MVWMLMFLPNSQVEILTTKEWNAAICSNMDEPRDCHSEWSQTEKEKYCIGCMRQVLGAGALGRPRGMGWGRRREGGSGWGTHVNPWLIHVNAWQKPLQYCNYLPTNKNKWKKKRNPLYVESKENWYKWIYHKTETDSKLREQILGCWGGGRRVREDKGKG